MQVGVIGFGYWGPNLVRNFMTVPGCNVTYVADNRSERLTNFKQNMAFNKNYYCCK
jgi:predicted dehydrogenase